MRSAHDANTSRERAIRRTSASVSQCVCTKPPDLPVSPLPIVAASTSVTFAPRALRWYAMLEPITPPPMITISGTSSSLQVERHREELRGRERDRLARWNWRDVVGPADRPRIAERAPQLL